MALNPSNSNNLEQLMMKGLSFFMLFYPLSSTRKYPSYGDCLEVKREYYPNCCVLDCVTQLAAHLHEQFLQVPTDWVCHIGTLTLCVEAVA